MIVGALSSTMVVYFLKKWILQQMQHQFDKKIEDYKSELQKDTISFQIEKTEFAKKKFDNVGLLYSEILNRNKKVHELYELIGYRTYLDIRRAFDMQTEADRKLKNQISLASLYIDDDIIKEIDRFIITCEFNLLDVVSIAENNVSKIIEQQHYREYRIVTNDESFNRDNTCDSLNKTRKSITNHLTNISMLLKNYLLSK